MFADQPRVTGIFIFVILGIFPLLLPLSSSSTLFLSFIFPFFLQALVRPQPIESIFRGVPQIHCALIDSFPIIHFFPNSKNAVGQHAAQCRAQVHMFFFVIFYPNARRQSCHSFIYSFHEILLLPFHCSIIFPIIILAILNTMLLCALRRRSIALNSLNRYESPPSKRFGISLAFLWLLEKILVINLNTNFNWHFLPFCSYRGNSACLNSDSNFWHFFGVLPSPLKFQI